MALRHIVAAVTALACGVRVLGAQGLTLNERTSAGECWEGDLGIGDTYYPSGIQSHASSDVADLFKIDYSNTFKVLTSAMAKEQYVLSLCGQSHPTDEEVEAIQALGAGYIRKHFSVPLQSALATSTVHLGFIEALGLEDRFMYIDQYASGPCWQKALGCGSKLAASGSDNRTDQMAEVDAVFMNCGSDCAAVNKQSNGVHMPTTQDSGAVETAEYIKFIAAFFNKEPAANARFEVTRKAYEQASIGVSSSPVVAWIGYTAYGGPSWNRKEFYVSQATYKLDIVTSAGGTNLNASTALADVPGLLVANAVSSNPEAGKQYSIPIGAFADTAAASAAFFEALSGVDVVIDETYAYDPSTYTMESFLSTYGLAADSALKFVAQKKVLRFDRTISSSNGLDWYESRIARPDYAVEGLARELHADESKRAKYFRNIAKGQKPDQVLTAEMCSKELPVCTEDGTPEPIVLEGPVISAAQCIVPSLVALLFVAVAVLV